MKKIILTFLLVNALIISMLSQSIALEQADSLRENNEYEKALNIYQKLLDKDKKNVLIINKLAKCYFHLEMKDSVFSLIDKSLSIDPKNTNTYATLCDVYYSYGDNEKALQQINKAILIDPNDINLKIKKASLLLFSDKLEESMVLFREIQKEQPQDASIYYYISYIYNSAKMPDSALKYINIALDKEKQADFYMLKTNILYSLSRFTDALFEIDKAIEANDKDQIYFVDAKAEIYLQLEQYKDVINLTDKYLEPYNANIYYHRIIALSKFEDLEKTFETIEKAIKYDPQNDIFYALKAELLTQNGNYNKALPLFYTAITLNPQETNYYYQYAITKIYKNTKKNIIDNNKKFTNINLKTLSKNIKLTKSSKSKYYYKSLLAKFNSDMTALGLDEYFMLYLAQTKNKNYSGYFNPILPVANAFKSENYEQCVKLATKLIEKYPTEILAYYYIANSYYKLEQYEKTIKYITIYYGFIDAILASGYGNNFDSPFIIAKVADEYTVLNYFVIESAGQEIEKNKGKNYDVINYFDETEELQKIYFYIDLFYGKK